MARREGQRRPASAARGGKSEEPEAFLGQFKRSDVFIAELCPGTEAVQTEVTGVLVSSGRFLKRRKKRKKERKPISSNTDSDI